MTAHHTEIVASRSALSSCLLVALDTPFASFVVRHFARVLKSDAFPKHPFTCFTRASASVAAIVITHIQPLPVRSLCRDGPLECLVKLLLIEAALVNFCDKEEIFLDVLSQELGRWEQDKMFIHIICHGGDFTGILIKLILFLV